MNISIKFFLKVFTFAFLTSAGAGLASDHVDSSATATDALADLLDLYAFVAPLCGPGTGTACEGDPEELVLALTLKPFATGADQFPDNVIYHFYLENDSGDTSQIDCTFSLDQVISCEGPGDLSVQARVGEIATRGDMRVYAGLRDDPLFFDLEAFADFEILGVNAFESPGTDFFAGSNVLAIVLGIRIDAIPAGAAPATNIQKVWAASERVGGDGLNGAISGSWYNPVQDGQGWLVEVVRMPNGNDKFVVYFYGYEFGEQVWLVGSSRFEGTSVSVDMVRTSGAEWGNAFNKDDVIRDVIGTMDFEFLDCDTANVVFTPGDTSLTSFSTSMQRLTKISSLECSLLGAGQVDRVGRPLVSMLLVPEEMKDYYNAVSDSGAWAGLFTDAFVASIESLDLVDGVAGNLLGGDAQTLAELFVDDRLQIDLKQPACTDYGAVELAVLAPGTASGCGGRGPAYDVVDRTLEWSVTGSETGVKDFVHVNDLDFPSQFPFLAEPHLPISSGVASWEVSTPEEQGLDSQALADMVQALLDSRDYYRLHQVVVIRNGQMVLNLPFYPFEDDRLHTPASIGKTITSTLIGIAIDRGFITSVDEPVLSFFPGWDIANLDARKQAITIAHLLAQRSGLAIDHSVEDMLMKASPNWVQWILDQPMSIDPGGDYSYTNANLHLAAGILKQATGMTPLEFASRYLFGPLGITNVIWPVDPQGVNDGAGGQLLMPTDLAKLGSLFLNRGEWRGQQIVSSGWVSLATSTYPGPHPSGWPADWSIGFAWAVNEQAGIIETGGSGGQVMRVWKDEQLTAVAVAGGGLAYNDCGNNGAVINEVLGDYLSDAIRAPSSIPPDPQGVARLASLVAEAALPNENQPVPPQPLPAIASTISGVRFELDPNPTSLEWFELTFTGGDEVFLEYQDAEQISLSVGLDDVYRKSVGGGGLLYRAKGWWEDDSRFVMHFDQISLGRYYKVEFLFEGDSMTFTLIDLACGDGTVVLTGHKQQ